MKRFFRKTFNICKDRFFLIYHFNHKRSPYVHLVVRSLFELLTPSDFLPQYYKLKENKLSPKKAFYTLPAQRLWCEKI